MARGAREVVERRKVRWDKAVDAGQGSSGEIGGIKHLRWERLDFVPGKVSDWRYNNLAGDHVQKEGDKKIDLFRAALTTFNPSRGNIHGANFLFQFGLPEGTGFGGPETTRGTHPFSMSGSGKRSPGSLYSHAGPKANCPAVEQRRLD
jgi:hypothetical protein